MYAFGFNMKINNLFGQQFGLSVSWGAELSAACWWFADSDLYVMEMCSIRWSGYLIERVGYQV